MPCRVLEWHGEQNPFGLDFVKAHSLCVRAAQAAGGVVVPPVWTGTGGLTIGRCGSMAVRPTTWRLLLADLFAQFEAVRADGGGARSGAPLQWGDRSACRVLSVTRPTASGSMEERRRADARSSRGVAWDAVVGGACACGARPR